MDNKKNKTILVFTFALVALVNLILLLSHEAWRDEAQSYLIARDLGPLGIFNITSYEGHPFLYYYLIMPFAKLGFPYITINILSFMLTMAGLYIIFKYYKFNVWIKVIIALSPAFIYFNPVFARSYALMEFLVILSGLYIGKRQEKPIIFGIVLAALTQTHIIILGYVMTVSAIWLFETFFKCFKKDKECNLTLNFAGLGIVLLSGLFLLFEFRDIVKTTALDKQDVAGENDQTMFIIMCLLGLALFVILIAWYVLKMNHKFKAFAIFYMTITWELIVLFIYSGHIWQLLSWIFVLFVCFNYVIDKEAKFKTKKRFLLYSVMITLALPAIISCLKYKTMFVDLTGNYSEGKEVAGYLDNNLSDEAIVYNCEDYGLAIIPYLKKAEIYNEFNCEKASFINRNKDYRHELTYEQFKSEILNQFSDKKYVYLIYGDENYVDDLDKHLGEFDKEYEIINSAYKPIAEHYVIYKIEVNDLK